MGLKAVVDREMVGLPGEKPAQQELVPVAEGPRGPGRPPGAINRSTREVKEWLERKYRSPLIGLAEIGAGASLDELLSRAKTIAQQLGCKPIEALKVISDAAERLAPYMHSKMPPIHDAKSVPGVTLIQVSAESVAAAGGDLRVAVMIATGEQNQGLSDLLDGELDRSELDGSDKA